MSRFSEAIAPYHHLRWTGVPAPAIHLEDVSGIPFVSAVPGVEEYQHRARVRAGSGDLFVTVTAVADGYEDYCQSLGLGRPDYLQAAPSKNLTQVTKSCMESYTYAMLCEWGKARGRVVIHPYMSIEDVWTLAQKLRDDGVEAEVLGPTPPALWVANDKAALSQVVHETLGDAWICETQTARRAEDIADVLQSFARRHNTIGLKRTRCASAMGNAVFSAAMLNTLSDSERLRLVTDFLTKTEWDSTEDVLIVEWVDADASPSTQTWIPPVGHGPVRIDGVYEQLLEGEEKVFVGSRPSTLPDAVNTALVDTSRAIGAEFQALGYVGRCSFDFVVSMRGGLVAKFTECNGRWGGTSTPMFLMDRLFDTRPSYIAQDWMDARLEGASFLDVHQMLQSELWDPRTRQGRFILYNVGPIGSRGKFDVVSIGEDPEDAERGVREILPELLERGL